MNTREITLGEETIPIAPFSPRKVLVAGQMLKAISGTVSEISARIDEFRADYRARNREVVTRQMAALPPWNQILDFMDADAWEKAGGEIELRSDPSDQAIVVEVFPIAFDLAEEEVIRLLALVIVSNQELGQAAIDGGREQMLKLLDEQGRKILDQATIGQLIDLLDTASQLLREEISAKADPLGRLRALWPRQTETTSRDQPAEASPRKPDSSTGSPAPTDGDTPRSSTGSPGAQPSASAA